MHDSSSDRRVLVIDDNVDLAENISEILEGEGLQTDVAESGEAALSLLEKHGYRLVITDLKMEGMSGLDVLRTVSTRWPTIPVLVMTAYARDRTLEQARREGAVDVVPKPVDIASLIDVVQRLVDAHGRVLVVEDDEDLRENLLEVLQACERFETSGVGTAREALQRLRADPHDVVVIDLRLPDGSGLGVAETLRNELGDECPALVFASAYPDDIAEALGKMSDLEPAVLRKPFPPAMLVSLVRKSV